LTEAPLAKDGGDEAVKDSPAIEQLKALHAALSDLTNGRRHPQLEPTNYGGTSALRHDERQFQTALVQLVEIVQKLNGLKNRKDAEIYVVRKLQVKYKDKAVSQRQLADMARAVEMPAVELQKRYRAIEQITGVRSQWNWALAPPLCPIS